MGTPEFAVPALEKLAFEGFEIAAVYTQPDKEAGRGRNPQPPPVKAAALELGLHVEQPATLKSDEAVQKLAACNPDTIVVAAYGKLLPAPVLKVPPRGVINIHPSLLPCFRGASPVASAILAGLDFTGVSVMQLDEGMDTGPVLAQSQVSISSLDTTGALTGKLARVGADLLLDVLPRWEKGEITPRPQDETEATFTRKFEKEDGNIDWALSAREIELHVRGLAPWPGSYTSWHGKQLKIIKAYVLPSETVLEIGRIVDLPSGFGVGTGNGVLGVSMVQLEGKREMTAAEFKNGQRDLAGSILPN